jgi:hypothetical protein
VRWAVPCLAEAGPWTGMSALVTTWLRLFGGWPCSTCAPGLGLARRCGAWGWAPPLLQNSALTAVLWATCLGSLVPAISLLPCATGRAKLAVCWTCACCSTLGVRQLKHSMTVCRRMRSRTPLRSCGRVATAARARSGSSTSWTCSPPTRASAPPAAARTPPVSRCAAPSACAPWSRVPVRCCKHPAVS